jgi:hypothetical protein
VASPERQVGLVAAPRPVVRLGRVHGDENLKSLLEAFDQHDDPITALGQWDLGQAGLADRLPAPPTSSFYRAFHDWTDSTPEQVRAGAA